VEHCLHGSYAASRHGGYGVYVRKKVKCSLSLRVARFVKREFFSHFYKVINVRPHFSETKEMTSKELERFRVYVNKTVE